ncbi:MAG TPA: trimethylamine methyltransferase family protein [Anaerolineales bacterium]|nr:trimethylamine methyltransferase family protein [Anaerolineales bacterium]
MRPELPHPLEFLSQDQLDALHASVARILQEVGVRVEWQPALEVFDAHGCQVDFASRVVQIPADVLAKALSTCPSAFILHGRDEAHDIHVTLEDVYTIAGSSALSVLDLDGGHRPSTLRDLADFTRLIDALPMADIMHAMVVPQDIPQEGFDRVLLATILQNTSKHYYSQGQGGSSVADQIWLASVVQGSTQEVRARPCFSFVICLNSPLVHSAERVQEMMECARYGIPVWLEATNMMGATAPVSIAGALVEQTANVLASVTLMQLLNPGHPCIFSIASGGFNMRSGAYVAASPEAVLLHCATAQMAHYFHLPFQGGSGVDSCLPDAQAGYERAMQAVPFTLARVNFIHLAFGMMDQLMTSSYEQAVIDNEIFEAAFRIAEGISVTEESMAVDQIAQAGPGGQYLNQKYTLRNYRKEQWQPQLTARLSWDAFQRECGGKDMRQRANELARRILSEHHPQMVDERQRGELERLVKEMQEAGMR